MRFAHSIRLVFLLITFSASVFGQSFTYGDFSVVASLAMNGNAYQNVNVLALTPLSNWVGGSAYHTTQMDVITGFDTSFVFQIQPTTIPADGMSFIIHNDPVGTMAYASTAGGKLGYAGAGAISNSVAIEFDTYQNPGENDSSGNEISVHTLGTSANSTNENFSLGRVTPPIVFSDGQPHTARILYTPGTLDIFLDNMTVPVLSVPYDFTTGGTYLTGVAVGPIGIAGTKALVGFTAANGGANETHDILSWSWVSTPLLPPCWEGTVTDAQGAVIDVLTVDGSIGDSFRVIERYIGQPFTITLAQPPANAVPAPFFLWGHLGPVPLAAAYTSPYGVFCFTPELLAPNLPWLFTLADSVSNQGVLPVSGPAPWNFTVPGVPIGLTFVLQGLTVQNQAASGALASTNAIHIDIVPYPAPTITQVTPLAPTPATQVTITGTEFQTGATLTLDGTPTPISSLTQTAISFTMPAGVPCDASAVITNPDGQAASTSINPTPVINNAIFNTGGIAGGQMFVLSGVNFAQGSTVTIGGAAAAISSLGPAVIQITTPPGSVGVVPVVITSPTGCSASTTYTYY